MAKEPDDPRVTELRRYRQEKAKAARKPPPRPQGPGESLLGSNPRAGLILVVVIVIIALLSLGPAFL
jgi:hypothetical protein